MKKVGIIGHFGFGQELANGQTVKTKNLSLGIKKYTSIDVLEVDSFGWSKHPFRLLQNIKSVFIACDTVIMLPAHNGVKFFAPLFCYFKKLHHKKIIYDVIGGWLPEFLNTHPKLKKSLQTFDGIWVETETMKKQLCDMGFDNVMVVPNFKELTPLTESELVYPEGFPLKLCTFSRVAEGKGIDTAVDVIERVNEKMGYTAFSLDIYGPVADEEKMWFEALNRRLPPYVQYRGCVNSTKSVEVLQNYYALLFPTHHYTEGVPGTIIDAYAAGVPVVSANWESCKDIVDDGKTGMVYSFDCIDDFEELMIKILHTPKELLNMKKNCLEKAKDYITSSAIVKVDQNAGGGYSIYPLNLCTFSRISKEKGIEDAIDAVQYLNDKYGFVAFTLTIFGQSDEDYQERFEHLKGSFPEYICYGGCIPSNESVNVLKGYFALLFPTYYEGEGFAGTLIDAYSAGIPVVATDWHYNAEIVKSNLGYLYPTHNQTEFIRILEDIMLRPDNVLSKKKNCIYEAHVYSCKNVIGKLEKELF